MVLYVSIIWALAKALDHTDYCSPTNTVEGQLAGWCWNPLLTKDWQVPPCWLGNTKLTKNTHFPLSSPSPPPLSCPVFHRRGYSCALSIFFLPPQFFLLHWGCDFLSEEAASLLHVPSRLLDRWRYACCCTVTHPSLLPISLLLSFLVMQPCTQCTHPLTYHPAIPPLILFIDTDESGLCLHPSLSFSLFLRLLPHSLLIAELSGFLLPSLQLFNSPTFSYYLCTTSKYRPFPLVSCVCRSNHCGSCSRTFSKA